jgi:hypothetical protein
MLSIPAEAILLANSTASSAAALAPSSTSAYANSGWDFVGSVNSYTATVIDSHYVVTAKHVGWQSGTPYTLSFSSGPNQGSYVLTRTSSTYWEDPNSDLCVWKITSGAFSSWASLYTSSNESGKSMVAIGRGVTNGSEVKKGATLVGYQWGSSGTKLWGTNTVSGYANYKTGDQRLFTATFDGGVGNTEAMLGDLDSGSGIFIKNGSTWNLAGIGYGVAPWSSSPKAFDTDADHASGTFNAAIFNVRTSGLYCYYNGVWYDPGTFNVSSTLFATRISSSSDWIYGLIPEPGSLILLALGGGALAYRRRFSRS